MSPNPQHGTPAGDASIAIRQLARQSGADVQDLQTLYVLEALLARIAASDYRDDFVLKGGVLLAAFAARRPTKDIDLQATGLANDADQVTARVRQIAALDVADGVLFDTESIKASVIRGDDEYAGIRVRLVGALGLAKLTIGIDVNFGDPIWPPPSLVELPRVVELGQPPVTLFGYPLTMVLAEKIVTAIDRGEANTRWRDFADVYTLVRARPVAAAEFAASLAVVAEYRHVELRPLLPLLAPMPQRAQEKWLAWRRRTGREQELPERFADVLESLARFADAVLAGSTMGRWNSQTERWQ
ncbi:nucleotidyl transferase AbiEii/AbiGii toxin family protein [Salinibacterium sp.]|uniref:nucleotidyl transferase AbiEii/AbiGii toxin family protein n=1 Tax=Salinibacterium sp. TaxID=1915057 RepID=UPI00286B74EB|nr:nucleotidyl transferase AbiEii/AbiGii toxin family protein [Salinibacterium sp.]